MTVDVMVREATEQDIPQIVELWKVLMDMHKELDPYFSRRKGCEEALAKFVTENIHNKDACVVVAEIGNEIAGYCQARITKYPPVLETEQAVLLHDCFVREDVRGVGIGGKLVNSIRQWCRQNGHGRIDVHHSTKNPRSGEFWVKMGFKPYLRTLYLDP